MSLKCGIIGLPNVGKSTIFNNLTKLNIKIGNFPFCTIKPNIGIAYIPDNRLNQLAKIVKTQNIIPASMKFIDVAGLVKGASQGEGLGNQFLQDIRKTEVVLHVVRCFSDEKISHISGKLNPLEDINIINNELMLADLEICERTLQNIIKNNIQDKNKIIVLKKCLSHLEDEKMHNTLTLNNDEKAIIKYLNLLTLKPTIYIANISSNGLKNNLYLDQVIMIAKKQGTTTIPICAKIKSNINNFTDEDLLQEINKHKIYTDCIIQHAYNLLNLQVYFTVGAKEIRAWTITKGINCAQAARKIHTDFKKGFIRAKTISFEDFIKYNGEQGAKKAGKLRYEGKNYIVQDGDIMHFLFNV